MLSKNMGGFFNFWNFSILKLATVSQKMEESNAAQNFLISNNTKIMLKPQVESI